MAPRSAVPVLKTGNLGPINGTVTIAVTFVFLAYFLHPYVESAFHRMKTYRAWVALEKNQIVEVRYLTMQQDRRRDNN